MAIVTTRRMEQAIRDAQRPQHPRRLQPPDETFPWDKISFGYKINPNGDNTAEVRIFKGTVFSDDNYLGYRFNRNIDTTDFILTTQVYAKVSISAFIGISFNATLGITSEWPVINEILLYNFACNDGVTTLNQIHHFGDIYITYVPPKE